MLFLPTLHPSHPSVCMSNNNSALQPAVAVSKICHTPNEAWRVTISKLSFKGLFSFTQDLLFVLRRDSRGNWRVPTLPVYGTSNPRITMTLLTHCWTAHTVETNPNVFFFFFCISLRNRAVNTQYVPLLVMLMLVVILYHLNFTSESFSFGRMNTSLKTKNLHECKIHCRATVLRLHLF